MLSFILLAIMFITTKSSQTKICLNCRFSTTSGKCLLFPKIDEDYKYNRKIALNNFLVTGQKNDIKEINKIKEKIDYFYCSTAREFNDMCGERGTKHKNK